MDDYDFAWYNSPEDCGHEDSDLDYINEMRANSLIEDMRNLETLNSAVHRANLLNYQLYSNRMLSCFEWGTGILTQASLEPVSRTTDNIVLEIIEALLSEIGKARPKAKPICHGASWKDRQMGKKLDKFLYGEFIRNDIYESVGKPALLNAEVCGFGCAKVTVKRGKGAKVQSCVESIFPDDILIDQQEVVTTKRIRHIYHRRVLPVEVVAATWDVDVEEVKLKAETLTSYLDYRPIGKGYVVVGEAYQAATGEKGDQNYSPGRRVVAINGIILEDEVWEHEWIPFVFFQWQRPPVGFYCQSAVEQILPDQIRMNEINDVITEAQDIMCGPRLLVQQGSKINVQSLDNEIGKILFHTGEKPEAVTWPAVAAELYQERLTRRDNAFKKMGLNQAASSGSLPQSARLDSSPAIRELNQVQDGRLADVTQRFEKFFLDISKTIIRVMKDSGKNAETVWFSGGKKSRAERIKWKDIDLDENSYTMVLEAASSFGMTPSAVRDDLEAKLVRGEISIEQYYKQIAQPDSDSETSLIAAAAENLDYTQELLEDGVLTSPTPDQDLVNGVRRMTLAKLNLCKYEDVPEEVFEAFLAWIEEAKMWIQMGSEPPVDLEAAPPVSAPPPGMPTMQPQPGMM